MYTKTFTVCASQTLNRMNRNALQTTRLYTDTSLIHITQSHSHTSFSETFIWNRFQPKTSTRDAYDKEYE